MSESVATLGAGKLLVFQPATGADEIALPVALGIQRFWSRRLKEAGRPSMYFVMVGKIERLVDAQVCRPALFGGLRSGLREGLRGGMGGLA